MGIDNLSGIVYILGMRHTCKDGQATKLLRSGPVGTVEGVTFTCPRCGYTKAAADIERDAVSTLNGKLGTSAR
jgi:ssDNA-binding Zn-finger/Zn-ribbon topoisomerase 1